MLKPTRLSRDYDREMCLTKRGQARKIRVLALADRFIAATVDNLLDNKTAGFSLMSDGAIGILLLAMILASCSAPMLMSYDNKGDVEGAYVYHAVISFLVCLMAVACTLLPLVVMAAVDDSSPGRMPVTKTVRLLLHPLRCVYSVLVGAEPFDANVNRYLTDYTSVDFRRRRRPRGRWRR